MVLNKKEKYEKYIHWGGFYDTHHIPFFYNECYGKGFCNLLSNNRDCVGEISEPNSFYYLNFPTKFKQHCKNKKNKASSF